ncbi:homocysteine S-methyltransferase family protein [Tepidibacter hydrothermalis]|uniref:Methionine synthase n=1 Tax=Tepidibacter hydrothermalis TaxID=3036126 RepID=A0ABY8EGC3_9FIRM|nr:homocysteine S-methyltransferase family protein [Tepidibacter hydrothermalis]WFD09808.1 homocysteine S-methyltransferase family protein [Tepidibacter hydrothermalis]
MTNILEELLVFDGAMGTMLQEEGLKAGHCPELMNVDYPDKVIKIHEKYLKAGADVITTNTFGGSRVKLKEYNLEDRVYEINSKAVEIAKKIADKYNKYVAASVGPTGKFVEPIGNNSFDEIYEIFKEQINALSSKKPDFILLETFNDLGEIRAALLAAKDVCDIPVICTLTYEGDRTLTGVRPESAAIVLESLGASAVGVNCSGGPEELLEVTRKICKTTCLPVIVQPNAGLPVVKDGSIHYPLDGKSFIEKIEPYFEIGVNIFGSCCGSTPEHTKFIKERAKDLKVVKRDIEQVSTLASREEVVNIGKNYIPKIIGERINPTANKKLAQKIKDGDFLIAQDEAQIQVSNGSHLIDVNVGTDGIDEVNVMKNLVNLIQKNVNAPLSIDSTDKNVLEQALKNYHGKAIVNSVNGEEKSLKSILPIVKRYGAGVIGLTLDENGIPNTVKERLEIAKKIVDRCIEYNIPKKDIYIDPLCISISTDNNAAIETLEAIKVIKKELGVNIVLGVSNISFGLPSRSKLNSSFLSMAILNGLDLAILNPLDENIMNSYQAASVLSNRDQNATNYISLNSKKSISNPKIDESSDIISVDQLKKLIVNGSYKAINIAKKLLDENIDKSEIIDEGLIKALDIVGQKFENKEYFLPQLMLSAEIVEKIFDLIKDTFSFDLKTKGTIVIGTVKGDVHDIGKNMVSVMLRSHGYKVVDLGKNVSPDKFLKAAKEERADVISLSALMTTTMTEIAITTEYIRKELPDIKIIAGGAVVTEEFAKKSGADGYSEDAVSAVKLVDSLI